MPTHRFIEEGFKNWRGMSKSGGRRIKRAVRLYLGYDQLFWNALAREAGDSLTAQAPTRIRCA